MAQDTQNSRFHGFGRDSELDGMVPIIYDPVVTGFRAAQTTDYLITLNGVSGNFNLFTGSTSISNFPSNQSITGTVDIKNLSSVQAVSGIVNLPSSSVSFTPTGITVTGAGSVSNKHYVSFILSSTFSGTIAGASFLGSVTPSYAFPVLENSSYVSVSYNIPSGSAQLISF